MKKITVAIGLWCAHAAYTQTAVHLRTQSRAVDFTGAAKTKPFKTGPSLPVTCETGEAFLLTTAAAGQNIYFCITPNTWQLQGSGVAGPHTHAITDLFGIAGKHGSGSELLTFGAGTSMAGDCAKFDAGGNVISSGAPCNVASGGNANTGVSFTAQTSVTFTHSLNTRNIVFQCYDASGNALEPASFTVLDENHTRVTFATPASGSCAVNGTGGGMGTAGGDLLGIFPNPTLAATGVVAGTYGNSVDVPVITVDAKGRLTSVSTVPAGAGAGGVAGGDLMGTYPNPVLTPSGVAPGTYGGTTDVPVITVDAKGRVTSATSVPTGGIGANDVLAGRGLIFEGTNPRRVSLDSAVSRAFLTGEASLSFASMNAHTCRELTIPVLGALTAEAVVPHWPNILNGGLIGTMFVSSADVVTVRLCNVLASTVNPTSGLTFSATIIKTF